MKSFMSALQARLQREHESLARARAEDDPFEQLERQDILDDLHQLAAQHGMPCRYRPPRYTICSR
jgi:hypothetical protein